MRKDNERLNDMIEELYTGRGFDYEDRFHNFVQEYRKLSPENKIKLTVLYIRSEVPPEDQSETFYSWDGMLESWCSAMSKEISKEKFLELLNMRIVEDYANDVEKYVMDQFDELEENYCKSFEDSEADDEYDLSVLNILNPINNPNHPNHIRGLA